MSQSNCPVPPADLLSRCLETIPIPVSQTVRARPFLDGQSQVRLGWLTVAASVPVIAALLVVPVRRYLIARAKPDKIVFTDTETAWPTSTAKPHSYWIFGDRLRTNFSGPAGAWFGKKTTTLVIWDDQRGYYTGAWEEGEKDGERRLCTLTTPQGTIYHREGDRFTTEEIDTERFTHLSDGGLRDLVDPKRLTQRLTGYGVGMMRPDGSLDSAPISVDKRIRGDWLNKKCEVYVCVQHPPQELAKRGAPTIRVRFFRDPWTGGMYGYDIYAYWKDDSHTYWAGTSKSEETPVYVGQGQVHLNNKAETYRKLLTPEYFTEGAQPTK